MGFMTGNFPPVDPATFMDKPYQERLKTLTRHWVEYGFGSPKVIMVMYLLKLVFFYVVGGVLVAHADLAPEPAASLGVVLPAGLLREGGVVDGAARVPRVRGLVGSAGRALQADERRRALLRAARHDPAGAVAEQGPVHQGR